ncbi:hypothetical protein [Micromonospora palythoicola]|uniref:hypothetical protein n=1 Tax=Micromonospora palythoicola TaxID=3120507 RepID=UPI002FCE4A05
MRPGWFTSKRYGSPAGVVGSVVAFGVLFAFAGYAIIKSSQLMSNSCIGDNGQMVCPVSGPDWARPLPGAAVFLGLLAGLAGLLAGRPVRTPALITGFLLTAVGLAGSWLIG